MALVRTFFVFAGVVFLTTVAPLWPQDGADRQEPFRVEVETVNLLVSVHDKDTGKFVTQLTAEDFEVFEDGVRQRVSNFSQQTDLPLSIALLVDTSSSVKIKLGFEKEAAADFVYSVLRPSDHALLLEFDTGVTLLHDFTSNPNDLVREIDGLRAGGSTALYDAIFVVSEQKMIEADGRKALVILSDGADVTSHSTYEDALRMAFRAEAAIYAISTTRFGADIDHEGDNALKQLTQNTGGRAYFPYSVSELSEAFQAINEELRNQYNLAYVPTNKAKDGTFRRLEVKVRRNDVVLHHRKGYYAPSPDGPP